MRDADGMRTTLDLDADILQAAKEMASVNGTTAGRVISDLVRKALAPAPSIAKMRNGVAFTSASFRSSNRKTSGSKPRTPISSMRSAF